MDLKDITTFLAISRQRSFSKAAALMKIGQPAATKKLQRIEGVIGRELVERSKRPVELTEAGQRFFELASTFVDGIEELKKGDIAPSPHIVVACAYGLMGDLLGNAVMAYRSEFPSTTIHIKQGSRREVLDMLDNEEADIGIAPNANDRPGLKFEPFTGSERVLIAPAGHPLSRRRINSLVDIADYPLVLLSMKTDLRDSLEREFRNAGATYDVALEVDTMDHVYEYVERGVGVGIGFRDRGPETRGGGLVKISLAPFLPAEFMSIVSRKSGVNAAAADLVAKLKQAARETKGPPALAARSGVMGKTPK